MGKENETLGVKAVLKIAALQVKDQYDLDKTPITIVRPGRGDYCVKTT